MAGKIFINYRRGDDPGHTGRLFDRLQDVFEPQQLFMDVDNIAPGLDFVRVLNERVAECDIVLAVIGKGWVDSRDPAGARRLEDPEDFVRIEIESALSQGKRVIPVLVGDSQMPHPEDLPEPLRPLARRNAVRLTHERFRADVQGLVKALQQGLSEIEAQRQAEAEARRRAQAEEERRRLEAEAARRAEEEAQRKKAELEAKERAAAERRRQEAEAKRRVEEERTFAAAKRTGSIVAFDTFLAVHPAGAFAEEAKRLKAALLAREEAYRRTSDSVDPAVLRSFLATYPKGADVDQVRVRLRRLEPRQDRRLPGTAIIVPGAVAAVLVAGAVLFWFEYSSTSYSLRSTALAPSPTAAGVAAPGAQPSASAPSEARAPVGPAPDEVAWLLLKDTTDEAALKRYVAKFPDSSMRKTAEARIADLEAAQAAKAKAEAEAAQKAQAAAQQALDAERAKAAAAQAAANQQAALATPPNTGPAATPGLSGSVLIQTIKMELSRVGCYAGKLDDDWASSGVKQSIMKFVKAAGLSKVPDNPSPDFLNSVRSQSSRVCPLECAKTEKELNGACVAKTCPSGQSLDSDGDCANVKEKTASRPPPAPAPAAPAGGGGGVGRNTGAVTGIGVSCGRFGCREHNSHPAPGGLPCKNAWQDRMGAYHCT
jgi:TIR domain